jgi:hypothetical protein
VSLLIGGNGSCKISKIAESISVPAQSNSVPTLWFDQPDSKNNINPIKVNTVFISFFVIYTSIHFAAVFLQIRL